MSNTKQELREKIIAAGRYEKVVREISGNVRIVETLNLPNDSVDALQQLLSDTVNKVLDELETKKGVIATGYDGNARTQFTDVVPLSAIEQVRKDFNGN